MQGSPSARRSRVSPPLGDRSKQPTGKRSAAEKSDYRYRRLLRAGDDRPPHCRAAEKRDELTPPHSTPSDLRGCQSIRWRTPALKQCCMAKCGGARGQFRVMAGHQTACSTRPKAVSYTRYSCRRCGVAAGLLVSAIYGIDSSLSPRLRLRVTAWALRKVHDH